MKAAAAFVSGLLFGAGLVVSGMTRPEKIIGFLDVFGAWDPALAFVMAGALAVYGVLVRLADRRPKPLLEETFEAPTVEKVSPRLLVGSALFGIGWGLSGFCPGPAVVAAGSAAVAALIFMTAMLAGMRLYRRFYPQDTDACG